MEETVQNKTATVRKVVIKKNEDKVLRFRKAYLKGTLKVDSKRVASKMIAFERQLERLYQKK